MCAPMAASSSSPTQPTPLPPTPPPAPHHHTSPPPPPPPTLAPPGHRLELTASSPRGSTATSYPPSQRPFLRGKAAMFAGGSFEIANFRKQNPNLKMDFIAPPAPKAGDKRLVSVFYDGGYAINAKSANAAEAIKYIRFTATKGFGDKFSGLLGNISPIKGVEIQDPLFTKVVDLNKTSIPYIMLVYFRYQDPTGSTLIQG